MARRYVDTTDMLDFNVSMERENSSLSSVSFPTQWRIPTAIKNHTVMVSSVMFGAGVLGNLLALVVLALSGPEQRKTLFYKVNLHIYLIYNP